MSATAVEDSWMVTVGTGARLTRLLNESLLPIGLKVLRSAAALEYRRGWLKLLDDDPALAHPTVRCACGSDKVLNYGIPRNNGRHFFCRTCERAFKAPAHRREWNAVYRAGGDKQPEGASWLEKFDQLLGETGSRPIMDLGSGCGSDTVHLRRRGFATISCDHAVEGLRRIATTADRPATVCCDMLDGLPFPSASFRVIVAGLSLHYFSWRDTEAVVADIRRVLMEGGILICRVNSTADTEHGAGQGTVIEEHYRDIDGKRKRFFDAGQLRRLFRAWDVLHCVEQRLQRSGRTKVCWEVAARSR